MSNLKIALLGCVRVTHDDWATESKIPHEIQGLLAYLLIHRQRTHPRDILAEVFWSEYSHDKARRALNTALWRLKRVLEPHGTPAGTYLKNLNPAEVGFNGQGKYWLDIEVFERKINHVITCNFPTTEKNQVQELESIIELYRGELLEGFYDEWALIERERLRCIYVQGLRHLMQYHAFYGAYEKARTYGQQILTLEPLSEDIHREMMRIYLESGQRALAARQYAICQLTLMKELGISPMEETQALYAQIFPEAHQRNVADAFDDSHSIAQILRQLQQASHTLDLAREQLLQVTSSITKYIRPKNEKISIKASNNEKNIKGRKQEIIY